MQPYAISVHITILVWKLVNVTGLLLKQSSLFCFGFFPLPLRKLVGGGIHSWGKDGHAGTETCARIDWSSTPAALWPGHVLVMISCVCHLVFTPVSFWILGKGRIKVLSFLILPIMSWTAERRQLCITSRAAECQGTMILWGTLGLWDPWGVLTPTAARRPMLPSAGTEAMAELQGGTGGAGWGCLPSTHRWDMVEGEHAQPCQAEVQP